MTCVLIVRHWFIHVGSWCDFLSLVASFLHERADYTVEGCVCVHARMRVWGRGFLDISNGKLHEKLSLEHIRVKE